MGGAFTLVVALGSLVVYLVSKNQCSGDETQILSEVIEDRNGVCRALGLPLAAGTGSPLLLVGILLLPPVVAMVGTIAAVHSGSTRPIGIACVLCAIAGLGLIIVAGNASVRHPLLGLTTTQARPPLSRSIIDVM